MFNRAQRPEPRRFRGAKMSSATSNTVRLRDQIGHASGHSQAVVLDRPPDVLQHGERRVQFGSPWSPGLWSGSSSRPRWLRSARRPLAGGVDLVDHPVLGQEAPEAARTPEARSAAVRRRGADPMIRSFASVKTMYPRSLRVSRALASWLPPRIVRRGGPRGLRGAERRVKDRLDHTRGETWQTQASI